MNGHELKKIFETFNSNYFAGKLPKYRIRVKHLPTAGGRTIPGRRLIEIGIHESHVQEQTLLHEMAHASSGLGHGKRFHAELQRLLKMGAPLGEEEVNSIRIGVRPRLSKARFESDLRDFLADNPQGTFASAVEWLNSNDGYADSVSEFVHKYPWARSAFQGVAVKCEAERALIANFLARPKEDPPIPE